MAKSTLRQQLSSLEIMRGQWTNITAKKAGMSQKEVQYILGCVDQIRVTLEWLETHEQIIRGAISSARALDSAQQEP